MALKSTIPSEHPGGVKLIHAAIAVGWLFAFTLWFHSFGLFNNQNIPRWTIWSSIWFDIPDVIDPPVITGSLPWSWFFLFQRIPFLSIAIAIWMSAWGYGSLALRMLGIALNGCERLFFSLCLGLSSVSLLMLLLGVCGSMSRWPLIVVLAVPCVVEAVIWRRSEPKSISPAKLAAGTRRFWSSLSRFGWVVLIVLVPFIIGQLLGAMSPQTDFDVVEYHLGGPKEWLQNGRISRLPHNVYTSFPFLTEMLILSGMVLYGDWQWGALAGQAVIAGFAPLTALGLFSAGRRWFSEAAGWMAALVYLTSPWTYRISIIAYAEGGLSCYLFAALFAALLFRDQFVTDKSMLKSLCSIAVLTGLLAGSAMACKYPGIVSVVVPVGLLLAWISAGFAKDEQLGGEDSGSRFGLLTHLVRLGKHKTLWPTVMVVVCFSMGVIVGIGPWLLKNTVETGNPVYPLAVRIFGGTDRTEDLDKKFRNGHAAKSWSTWKDKQDRLRDLPVKLTDVMANNDWHSSLMFGLAPLSLFWCLRRQERTPAEQSERIQQRAIVAIIWFYIAWQFFSWWILTHHIDRFYVPMFSAVALLAGIGASWCRSFSTNPSASLRSTLWTTVAGIVVAASLLYNAEIMVQVGGFNAGRLKLTDAQAIAENIFRRVKWLNEEFESGHLPPDTKVLCVGEAQLFHARYPYLYNTVFDHSLFEKLCADPNFSDHRLRPVNEIRAEFRRLGITHVDVNWAEILRYRGNYGYTDFVHPDRFIELQKLGVLGSPLNLPIEISRAPLGSDLRNQLEQWAPGLITTVGGEPAYVSAQIFPVLESGVGEGGRQGVGE